MKEVLIGFLIGALGTGVTLGVVLGKEFIIDLGIAIKKRVAALSILKSK